MVIRVGVGYREAAESLVNEFGSLFGGSRVWLEADGEIVVELRHETKDAIDKALKAIERWLTETEAPVLAAERSQPRQGRPRSI